MARLSNYTVHRDVPASGRRGPMWYDPLAMNRWRDWWGQCERDLRHAENALDDSDFEWAAFAAQQAADKALKALIMAFGGDPWGHSITGLIEALPPRTLAVDEIIEAASRLDKHYIPARYPNGF